MSRGRWRNVGAVVVVVVVAAAVVVVGTVGWCWCCVGSGTVGGPGFGRSECLEKRRREPSRDERDERDESAMPVMPAFLKKSKYQKSGYHSISQSVYMCRK